MRAGEVFPRGEEHWAWKDEVKVNSARARARREAARDPNRPTWCGRCGFMLVEEIHHRDGNPRNNERDNLEFLCVTCHDNADTTPVSNPLSR